MKKCLDEQEWKESLRVELIRVWRWLKTHQENGRASYVNTGVDGGNEWKEGETYAEN